MARILNQVDIKLALAYRLMGVEQNNAAVFNKTEYVRAKIGFQKHSWFASV
jgi:hypothetical protein